MIRRRIVVAHRLADPADLDLVRDVHPDIELTYTPFSLGPAVMRAFATSPAQDLQAFTASFPQPFLAELASAEVVYGVTLPVDVMQRAPKLRWFANALSGSDHLKATGILNSQVVVTSSKGVAAASIAEFAVAQFFSLFKCLPQRLHHQQQHRWEKVIARDLRGATLGIVGLGEIGSVLAALASALGMRVLAVRRRPDGPRPAGVDAVFAPGQLHDMLGQCDAVAITVAHTPETRNLFGAGEFAAMRPGAVVVNVSRGELLDEDAFADAVRSGHLGGGALDVFVHEPLPKDSPLWDLPNVSISAHNCIARGDHSRRAYLRFVSNLERYLRGEPLEYRVDPTLGY